MDKPKYQDIKSSDIPSLFKDASVNLKLVSGEYNGLKGPASTYTSITAIMGEIQKGKEITLEFPVGHESLVYILDGTADVNDKTKIEKYNMVTFDNSTGRIYIKAIENSRLLILNAAPIHEPVVAYGPFVMNTMDEIKQAYEDYHAGKFGTLTY